MVFPHLRDLAIPTALSELGAAGAAAPLARRIVIAVHQRGATDWEDLGLSPAKLLPLQRRFRFGPLLDRGETSRAEDGTCKYLFRAVSDRRGVEVVLVRNRNAVTLCLSSQAGCALGCSFCATAQMGLERHLTAGEITEAKLRAEREAGVRVSDVVFMGQGEPLHNYDAVMDACANLNHDLGPHISRKRITISTVGLTPQIRRYARERRRWRLHLSLHSAIQATRAELMPMAHRHPLPELLDAMREYQRRSEVAWVTLQYIAIPGVNMDLRHVNALRDRLAGLRHILNVIPYNDTGAYRPPTWAEVKEFTTRLRKLGCPVKVRYSAGKRAGMGCGQLSSEMVSVAPSFGHALAPPGIFTG